MGLFGDKDLKRLDEEILAMKMALEMSDLSSSNPALEKGLAEGVSDIATLILKLDAKGKGPEARSMLKGIEPKKFGATARARFDDLNLQIEQRIS